jgi:phosphomannomutase
MDRLIFGTDGWRDVIADKFTYANVARAAQAYADYLKAEGETRVLVGYDTRFNGPGFARRVAEVLVANGLEVLLAASYLPTPALSFAVKHLLAGGGVMLTASHNPPMYHGFKLKGPYGGSATDTIYKAVASRINSIREIAEYHPGKHAITHFDIREAYFEALTALVNVRVLKEFTGTLVHEAMGGSGTGWLTAFFDYIGNPGRVVDLHPQPDPLFYGVNPEPITQNLGIAQDYAKTNDLTLLTATDGDADRIGAVLSDGTVFNSHQIFAVLLDVLQKKGLTGQVVKTFTVSRVVERLAEKRGLSVSETPVGFKYITDAMLRDDVLIGGEESGGIGVKGHIPERDGIANSLLLLEAVITSGKSLGELFTALADEVDWQHAYDRIDLHLQGNALKDKVMARLASPLDIFAGRRIEHVETLDGVKLNLSGKAWLMFRPSGTEPVLRIYCEAQSEGEVAEILSAAQGFVESDKN